MFYERNVIPDGYEGNPHLFGTKWSEHFNEMGEGFKLDYVGFSEGASCNTFVFNVYDGIIDKKSIAKMDYEMKFSFGKYSYAKAENGKLILSITKDREYPSFEDYYEEALAGKPNGEILVGIDDQGEPVTFNISDSKSILIAGSSGAGKSVAMHGIALSLLLHSDKKKVKTCFIDLKGGVEFMKYRSLAWKTCANAEEAISLLERIKRECEYRYRVMRSRGIEKATCNDFPYIVVFIDEYAELVTNAQNKKELERLMVSILQICRACGIFFVIATQHPTNQNLSNAIRVNVQSRLGLRAANSAQSVNIMGDKSCVSLRGNGDGILRIDGRCEDIHLQCFNVTNDFKNKVIPKNKKRSYENAPTKKDILLIIGCLAAIVFFMLWK